MLQRVVSFFFFNDTATTEIYTLSLHDALPISDDRLVGEVDVLGVVDHDDGDAALQQPDDPEPQPAEPADDDVAGRSEEHTSELQSRQYLVCRLLLEKKK